MRRLAGFVDAVPNEVAGGVGGHLSLASYLLLPSIHSTPRRFVGMCTKSYWRSLTDSRCLRRIRRMSGLTPCACGMTGPRPSRRSSSHAHAWVRARRALDAQGLTYWIVSSDPPSDRNKDSRLAFERDDPAPAPTRSRWAPAPCGRFGRRRRARRRAAPAAAMAPGTMELLAREAPTDLLRASRHRARPTSPDISQAISPTTRPCELIQLHPRTPTRTSSRATGTDQRPEAAAATRWPGPLRLLADQARRTRDAACVLVDEINRGNIGKVFGELYFLLEYREEGCSAPVLAGGAVLAAAEPVT